MEKQSGETFFHTQRPAFCLESPLPTLSYNDRFCKYYLPFSGIFSLCQLLLNIGLVTHFRSFPDLKNPNSQLKIRNSKFQNGLR